MSLVDYEEMAQRALARVNRTAMPKHLLRYSSGQTRPVGTTNYVPNASGP
jgi:hypothetical protein